MVPTTLTEDQALKTAETGTTPRILQNFIGGRWVPARSSEALDVTNPANGEVLARVPLSGRDDLQAAVTAAAAALPDWRARAIGDRTQFIYALREQLLKHL